MFKLLTWSSLPHNRHPFGTLFFDFELLFRALLDSDGTTLLFLVATAVRYTCQRLIQATWTNILVQHDVKHVTESVQNIFAQQTLVFRDELHRKVFACFS